MSELRQFFPRERRSADHTITTTPNIERNKTYDGEQRVKNSGFYEEEGRLKKSTKFQGRPIIGHDRPINRGVYLGAEEREAIVVDDTTDSALGEVYEELLRRRTAAKAQGIPFKEGILEEVWKLVNTVMPYNEEHVQEVLQDLPDPDSKIGLSSFIGGGVCRHQALLTAYLLERLGREGYVGGKVSVDRNYVEGLGGHAWARYENSAGVIFILDSAQNYVGPLQEMDEKNQRWFYERPEDTNPRLRQLKKLKQKLIGFK